MARRANDWTIRPRDGVYAVRFWLDGKRVERGTGERDPVAARRAAERIYREHIARTVKRAPSRVPFVDIAADWLAPLDGVLDPLTFATYERYLGLLSARWPMLGDVTTEAIRAWQIDRLRVVQRKTVRKELSVVRQLVAHAHETGRLDAPIVVPPLPARAAGTVAQRRGRRDLTPEQARDAIAALPESGVRCGPVRARAIVAYETGLRPATLDALTVGDVDLAAGSLLVRTEADKARWGRDVPVSAAAVAALRSAIPGGARADHVIFGAHDYRPFLAIAARAIGVDRLTWYDLRHARATHALDATGDRLGIAYLLGHRQIATTERYLHAGRAHAARVIASGEDGGEDELARRLGAAMAAADSVNLSDGVRTEGVEPSQPFGHRNLNAEQAAPGVRKRGVSSRAGTPRSAQVGSAPHVAAARARIESARDEWQAAVAVDAAIRSVTDEAMGQARPGVLAARLASCGLALALDVPSPERARRGCR